MKCPRCGKAMIEKIEDGKRIYFCSECKEPKSDKKRIEALEKEVKQLKDDVDVLKAIRWIEKPQDWIPPNLISDCNFYSNPNQVTYGKEHFCGSVVFI